MINQYQIIIVQTAPEMRLNFLHTGAMLAAVFALVLALGFAIPFVAAYVLFATLCGVLFFWLIEQLFS